jgi:hypothetical protein
MVILHNRSSTSKTRRLAMKSVHFALLSVLLSPTLTAKAAREIFPAGSLINCTITEAKLSSKNAAVGDPILCQVGITSRNGPGRLPFDSYLEGRFEDFKDPGHFVGKGWMELKFDRMIVEPRTIVPISARVVDVPGYAVDREGRILGKGHRTRDIVEWSIPILWPIDLLNLPRRGPRPTLKTETRLTLKVMDDTEVPIIDEPDRDPSGLIRREPNAYAEPPDQDNRSQQQMAQQGAPRYGGPRPQEYDQLPQQSYNPPPPAYQPPPPVYQQQAYAPQPAPVYLVQPSPLVYVYAAPPPPPVQVYMYPSPPPIVAAWGSGLVMVPGPMAYQSQMAYRNPVRYRTAMAYRQPPGAYGY